MSALLLSKKNIRCVASLAMPAIRCAAFALTALAVVPASAQEGEREPKARLVAAIVDWIAQSESIAPSRIEVLAGDRRFRVPACEGQFAFDYMTKPRATGTTRSNATVRAACDSTEWTAQLRVNITAQARTLVFTRELPKGSIVAASDLRFAETSDSLPATLLDEWVGRTLSARIEAGQAVADATIDTSVEVFATVSPLRRGEAIPLSATEPRSLPYRETSSQQRLSRKQLNAAVARRDIAEGTVLSLNDLQFANDALVASTVIEQGSMFDASNFETQSLFRRLPSDAVLDPDQLRRATTKRRLTPGDVIRYSDIQMVPQINVGETVKLTVKRGSITLTVDMQALEDGYIGDRVELRNDESGETVMATVTGVGAAIRN
jgi:flagella basal body P-ring formation protein FlgA